MSSVERLVDRLSKEVATARARVQALQTEAAEVFPGKEQRLALFVALRERIHAILHSRLKAFAKVDVFKDMAHTMKLKRRRSEGQRLHERTTTLFLPSPDGGSENVELSFRLTHDTSVENAIMDYHLEMPPTFILFDSNDQLVIRIDKPSEGIIMGWVDNKLVGFTRTYIELLSTEQYQRQSFETDPVTNIRFPRRTAAGKKEYQGRIYHFYTKESLQAFETAPSAYVEPRPVATAACLNGGNVEMDHDQLQGVGHE